MKKTDFNHLRTVVALACVFGALMVLPAVASAAGTGEIKGTVTDTAGNPLGGIGVCAKEAGGGSSCGTTAQGTGDYVIAGLAGGNWEVYFFSGPDHLYLTQFYDEKESEDEALPVGVTEGHVTEEIDAKMHEGGKVSGTVTALTDGSPLEGISACLVEAGGAGSLIRCVETDADGSYVIPGLYTGAYEVEFSVGANCGCASRHLISQTSDQFAVTAGATTADVDARMVSANKHKLTVSRLGEGTGTVTSAPAGIECGLLCDGEFGEGQEVTLTATPTTGSAFYGWSVGACGVARTCRVEVDRDVTVTARFTPMPVVSPSGGDTQPLPPAPKPVPEAPGTNLLGAKIDSAKGTATFRFRGSGAISGFLCKLTRPVPEGVSAAKRPKPKFASCRSPKTYRHLASGRYVFSAAPSGREASTRPRSPAGSASSPGPSTRRGPRRHGRAD